MKNIIRSRCYWPFSSKTNLSKKFVFLLLCMATISLHASEFLTTQNLSINGTVTDSQGMPLSGANVIVKGTNIGAVTDFDGNYSLNNVPSIAKTLVVSFLGYKTLEIPINGQSQINVSLQEDADSLDEVVIVGYGTQTKASVTNAISTVKGGDLAVQAQGDLRKSLQGLTPGLNIVDNGGQPGDLDFRVTIRGVSSLNDSNPLILVDGIVQESLSGIDPNSIESVSVLKDAASTAIYGSRGANGIILITTKKGSKDRLSVTYDGFHGWQSPTIIPEFVDTEGYMRFMTLIDQNSNGTHSVRYTEDQIQDYLQAMLDDPGNNPPVFYDWDDVFVSAPQQNHSLTVTGGGNIVTSMANLGFFKQDGVYPNRSFNRYQVRLNNTFNITDNFKGTVNFFGLRGKSKRPTQSDAYYFAVQGIVPNSTPFSGRAINPDGTYNTNGRKNVRFESDPEYQGLRTDINDFFQTNLGIDWEPIEGLKYSATYAYQKSSDKMDSNRPTYRYFRPDGSVWAQNTQNRLNSMRGEEIRTTFNSLLSYEKKLGKHLLYGLVGYSSEEFTDDELSVGSRDFLTNSIRSYGSTTNIEAQQIDNDLIEWGLVSYFGRFRYAWDEKYFLELSGRYDGSSRFKKENRFTFFPAASAAWNISKEKFWKPIEDVVNNFKVRYSWGVNGNQNVGPYERFPALNVTGNVVFGDQLATGVIQRKAAGENIIWEETSQHNFGIDASFLNNKLDFTFDYFNKKTENILLSLPVAVTFGLDAPRTNAGEITNKGWEVSVNWRDNIADFNYRVGLNFASVDDRITDFAGLPRQTIGHRNGYYGREEGTPVVAVYGFQTDGFFDTQEEIDNNATWGPKANIVPGDIKYVDQNGDGTITGEDAVPIGDTTPKYTFGLNINAEWKGFDLSMFWQGAAEVDTYLAGYMTESGGWANSGVTKLQVENYWQGPGDDSALFPLPQTRPSKNIRVSDKWMLDGAYFRLKSLTFGYSLPETVVSKLNLSKVRFYYTGNNILTISGLNKWGIDPEDAPYSGYPANRSARHTYYAQLKSHNFGVTIGL